MKKVIAPIEETSVLDKNAYLSVTERYFTPMFYLGKDGEDFCILFHSNRICIITLASRHPVRRLKKNVTSINFHVSTNVDRLTNKVTGKGKHGGQCLQPSSPLCFLKCDDGTSYPVLSCLSGKLVEMNEALILHPELLVEKPQAEGFIAIILPNINNTNKHKQELLTLEEYEKECLK